jgi:2-polyprenyl-3-methyl-5-hydroxy-6-metoxy-1,4-benzoquinol methylase
MKTLVKKCLGCFGYEIRRLPRKPAGRPQSESAIDHNSREQREHFYSDADQVTKYLNEDRRNFYREVTRLITQSIPDLRTSSLRIADYGCGPGMLLKELGRASPGSRFYGYDFASAGIRVARDNFPAASFGERDIYLPYPDRYDVIVCTEVLEHLERPQRAMASLLEQLSAGGLLLLTVPDGRIDQYSGHIHFWSPESWKLFLEDACPELGLETGRIAARTDRAFLYACILRPREQGSVQSAAGLPPTVAASRNSAGIQAQAQ